MKGIDLRKEKLVGETHQEPHVLLAFSRIHRLLKKREFAPLMTSFVKGSGSFKDPATIINH